MAEEERLTKEQIEWQQYDLTNRRINKILEQVDINKYKVWKNTFNAQDVKEYLSSVLILFDETFSVFKPEQIEKIVSHLRNASQILRKVMAGKSKNIFNDLFNVVKECDKAQQLIRLYLQQYGYFFKKGEREVKSFEDAIKILDEGGGIFGNIEKS